MWKTVKVEMGNKIEQRGNLNVNMKYVPHY